MDNFTTEPLFVWRGRGRGGGRGRWRDRGRGRGRGRGVMSSAAQETYGDESTDVGVQSVRRGLTQGARELCQRYNGGPCSCSRLHHQKKAPYVWQYLPNTGDWRLLSNTGMEFVEQAFCNNEDSTVVEIKLSGNMTSTVVNFGEILDPPRQTSYNQHSFRRLSTRSYVEAGSDDISLYTQWVWYWEDNEKEWSPFVPTQLQLTLETKYLAGQDTYLYTIGEQEYRLDFTSLVQVNRKYQTRRPVHRRPVFVCLDDARYHRQKCSSLLMSPATATPTDVPLNWTPLDHYQNSEKVELETSADEFATVMSSIYKTLSASTCQVQRVYRLQNALLWHNYCSMKKTLQMSHGTESIDVRHLFHGTDTLDVVNNICINNFDFRVSGKNATVYGKGAYFAGDAKYSHSYTKGRDRYMFLARVLVGKYTLGDSSYTRPPPRKGHVLYDSCVNDEKNPSIFVIFERNQCYPEYLVEYRDGTVIESVSVNRRNVGNVTRTPVASAPVQTAQIPSKVRKPAPPVPTNPPAALQAQSNQYRAQTNSPPASSVGYSFPRSSYASMTAHGSPSVGSSAPTYAPSVSSVSTSSVRVKAPAYNQASRTAADNNPAPIYRREMPTLSQTSPRSNSSNYQQPVFPSAPRGRVSTSAILLREPKKTKDCIIL